MDILSGLSWLRAKAKEEMTKGQFRKELIKFVDELYYRVIDLDNDHPSFKYHEYYILPVKKIWKVKLKTLGKHSLFFTIIPDLSILFEVHFRSKLLHGLHPLKTPEKKWPDIGSKSFAYAQRWNRTVYDLLSDSRTNKYKKEIQLFDEFFDQSHIDPNDYKSLIGDPKKSKKPKGKGGRPAGRRNESTIKKYNYIRNKYHILKKKQLAHTIEEYARLIRSEMLEKKPEVFEGGFYSLSTIIDIIKKQKWGD